jgi:hypothetical protein
LFHIFLRVVAVTSFARATPKLINDAHNEQPRDYSRAAVEIRARAGFSADRRRR